VGPVAGARRLQRPVLTPAACLPPGRSAGLVDPHSQFWPLPHLERDGLGHGFSRRGSTESHVGTEHRDPQTVSRAEFSFRPQYFQDKTQYN
jgi:hypothetical protein